MNFLKAQGISLLPSHIKQLNRYAEDLGKPPASLSRSEVHTFLQTQNVL